MKICIDGRLINESGIGRYIRNLLKNLELIDKENEYFILLKKIDLNKYDWGNNFKKVEADFGWYSAAEQIRLPGILKKLNPDIVHFPHFNVPLFFKGKFVVTIHDLIHQHFAMKRATTLDPITYRIKQFGYHKVFTHAVKKSHKIIVPSNFVKSQLSNEWSVEPSKISVTHEGVDDRIMDIKNKQKKSLQMKILEKIGVKKPYIFYIGNAHPHKNIEGLIKAFRILKKTMNDERIRKNLSLVLAGGDHYFWKKIKNEYTDPDIVYPGYVTDDSLVALFSNAEAFVMPSFEEGFGIPVLESYATNCPVICSDVGALTEVGGNGSKYFNPKNPEDIAQKILEVITNDSLEKKMIASGSERLKQFSWKKLAEETLDIYKRANP